MSKLSKKSIARRSQAIIKASDKRVEVMACPGSGKTYTLLKRLEHLARRGVPASDILVLSFSNESVNDLRRRIVHMKIAASVDEDGIEHPDLTDVTIKTVHAFAKGLTEHRSPGLLNLTPEQALALFKKAIREVVDEEPSRREVLKELLDSLPALKRLMAAISYARSAAVPASKVLKSGRFEKLKQYAAVANRIQRRYGFAKRKVKKMDFADMLSYGTSAIKCEPRSISFTHVLVDEYQDSSAAQAHLLAALVNSARCEVMVFGDSHQAIYGFAGSHYTPLGNVLDDVQALSLPVSHRLTRPVAALASEIAGHTKAQAIVSLRDGPLPVLVRSSGLTAQTHAVVRHIRKLVNDGVPVSSIAVLARTKAFLAPVEQRLLAKDIQTVRLGEKRDLQHPERVLKLVGLVEGHARRTFTIDADALRRIVGQISPFCAKDDVWDKQARALQKAARAPSTEGRYQICADVYLRCLGGINKNKEIQIDVNRWARLCRGRANARALIEAIKELDPPGLVTATIHAAKGREWEHVFVVGLADGQLPLYLARSKEKLEEERRLLYVAITRTKNTLHLYHAPVNHARSRGRFADLSRFLKTDGALALMEIKGEY